MRLRPLVLLLTALGMIAALLACSSGSGGTTTTTTTTTPTVAITATAGSGQSAVVGGTFGTQLTATVTTNGAPASGMTVTFAVPTSGASGTFAGGVNTATTNSSGVATAPVFTANTTAGTYMVMASVSGTATAASFSLTNTAAAAATITATAGATEGAAVNTAFATNLQATVTDMYSNPVSGVSVTFTAPTSGPSGTFAGATNTAAGTTNSSGVATAPAFTANATTGAYTVTAAATGISTPANFSLNNAVTLNAGTYTFWLAGTDSNGSPYYVAGAFTTDGAGTITGGEQDFVDYYYVLAQDSVTGSYLITADGNIQITLNTGDVCIGPGANSTCGQSGSTSAGNGEEILNATLTSVPTSTISSARIIEFDTWATASGQLEPQIALTATPLGGYAFSVAGVDGSSSALALGIGGVIDVDSSGGISGTGSVFDDNDGGTILQAQDFTASTVTPVPDGFGRVTFTLNPSSAAGVPQIALIGYFVDSSHVRLVETADNLGGTTGGQAFAQTGTGTFTTSSFEGASYVFGAGGFDNSADGVLQVAGVLTGNSDGSTLSGNLSFNDLTNMSPQGGTAITGGTYTVDSTGRVTLTGVTDGATFTYNLQLYLDGNGDARVLSMDANDEVDGLAGQQKAGLNASTFKGTYALGAVGVDSTAVNEFDAVGPVVADGVGNVPGFVDLNWIFSPSPGPTFSDEPVSPATFTATATAGIFTGNITGIDVTDCQVFETATTTCTSDAFTYYFVSSSTVVGIENDANQLTLIRFELQQ